MTARAERRDNLADLIFDMDEGIGNLVMWGRVVRDLGTGSGEVDGDGVFIVGQAILAQAQAVREEWQRCFDLTRAMREGSR